MFTRRSAIGCATAAILTTPSILRAHTEDTFVLPEQFQPKEVRVREQYTAGMILVIPHQFYLYHIFETERAIRYGVGVGRAGLEFKGTAIIERKAKWPSWRPTNDMIRRDPDRYAKFADGVPGGPDNPLGARALYLYQNGVDTYYRIHGTTEPSSIGKSVSNGCIPYVTLSGVQFIMFGASTPKTAEAALVKPSSSYLSSDLQVIGDIKTSSILNIDAAVKGNVIAEKLNVSAQARIEGDVTASDLSVSGEIEGTITGGIVALESTANIVGVIRYDSLSVQAGASVEGQLASRRKVDPAT